MAGKGDKRRPREVDKKTFEDNWNRIFKKKKENPLPFTDSKPNENMFCLLYTSPSPRDRG